MGDRQALAAMLRFTLCWCGSLTVGLLLFGPAIFQRHAAIFQFVATGAVAAFAAAGLAARGARWLPVVCSVGFLVIALTAGSVTLPRLVRDAVLVLAVVGAVSVGLRLDVWFPRVPVGKFVLWAALFGACHGLAVLLIALLLDVTAGHVAWLPAARLGTLIGAGVGLGHELATQITRRRAPAGPGVV